MASRRSFIVGMLAAGLAPKPTWGDAGDPAYLSAAMAPDGLYLLCGLTTDGRIAFKLPLPGRGHAAAAHPTRPEAVAFARRPGNFAIVLDCLNGKEVARLHAPTGRHFYGHGTFSADGTLLFTTENDFDAARGVIGIWDARKSFKRIGEFSSGGVGPHDVKLMPDGETLVVANGGIETHPETGRTKLNLPSMRSNLCYVDLDGVQMSQFELGKAHQRNSIRHLAVAQDGTVAFAMQWQGDLTADLSLLGRHHSGAGVHSLVQAASVRKMHGYLGSVAITGDGARIAATSPRSGRVQIFDQAQLVAEREIEDVCGVARSDDGFFLTTGTGHVHRRQNDVLGYQIAWDNHLIPV